MKICLECGRKLSKEPLFVLENAPASAQDIPDESELGSDKGIALALCQCPSCHLVQFDCEPVPYYRDVIRAGGLSTTMTELRREQYAHLIDTYHLEGKRFIEVGCGSGEFLKILTEFPVQAYGIEHRKDLVQKAQADGLSVSEGFTDAPDTVFPCAPYDVFLSFNFLEHQPQPGVMLQAIYNNLTDDGLGLVTVPALEYIANRGTYYELIRDHLAYYSAGTLKSLMNRNGFEVLEQETINRDTLSVIVRKIPGFVFDEELNNDMSADMTANTPKISDMTDVSVKADVYDISNDQDSYTDFDIITESINSSDSGTVAGSDSVDASLAASLTEGYHKVRHDTEALTVLLSAANMKLALWGAGHQGFTLASTTALGDFAEYIIDSAPFKQGRYAPASHLPIVPPEHFFDEPVDAILIAAPGYTEEIADEIRDLYGDAMNIFALRSDEIEDLS